MKKQKPYASTIPANLSPLDDSSTLAWENNPHAQTLRVDLQYGAFFILPYSHFAFAHLAREADRESLHVSFTTHDVRISGRNLRDLGLALQKLTVDWIREVPLRYSALTEQNRALIERIEVTEISETHLLHR